MHMLRLDFCTSVNFCLCIMLYTKRTRKRTYTMKIIYKFVWLENKIENICGSKYISGITM